MAINPFRIGELQIPANPKPIPLDFSPLQDLGASIGAYRERQQLGDLLAGATDPQGNLDINKAARALAVSGRTREARELLDTAIRSNAQTELTKHYRSMEESARIAAERPQYSVQAPVEPDILAPGRPGTIIELPRRPGEPPKAYPYPTVPAPATPAPATPATPAPVVPAPRSSADDVLPAPAPTAAINPEEAAPYRVAQAGGAIPPPPTAAPAAPPATPRNEAYLRSLPTDAGRTLVKGVAEYEIDPMTLDNSKGPGQSAGLRDKIIAAAKTYRPDYSTAEYQKRGSPPSGEVAARIGLGKKFLDLLDDQKDAEGKTVTGSGLRARVASGEMNDSLAAKIAANFGQGGPGELRAAIDEGSEALLRGLTGAGMSASEAANYARRYQFGLIDSSKTALRKLNDLESALRYVGTEVGKGRGGEDFLKDYRNKFGEVVGPNAPQQSQPILVRSPEEARQIRKQNPKARLINLQGEIFEP
jgi:hypothetical protein